MKIIKLPLSVMSNATLSSDGKKNFDMMTNNAKFTALAGQVTAFGEKLDLFDTAVEEYNEQKSLLAQLHSTVEERRHDLEMAYRSLASAAEGVTLNPADLESGGWTLRKTPAPIGQLPAPGNLRATAGAYPGTADLECDPVHGAVSYVAECATSAAGPFTVVYQGTRPYCTATGMNSGGLYYFRMLAVGAAGPSPYSDISEKRAA